MRAVGIVPAARESLTDDWVKWFLDGSPRFVVPPGEEPLAEAQHAVDRVICRLRLKQEIHVHPWRVGEQGENRGVNLPVNRFLNGV